MSKAIENLEAAFRILPVVAGDDFAGQPLAFE
jgi:hypothetical protein